MDQNNKVPGKSWATASLILGIISLVLSLLIATCFVAVPLSIIGLILASQSKKVGYLSGKRTTGFILSLIALILGSLEIIFYIWFFTVGITALGFFA